MTSVWDPGRYLGFADQRSRPGYELIARIHHPRPRAVVDLGCGTGGLTAALARRWPGATVTGIDSSPTMLDRAADLHPRLDWPTIRWQHEDIAGWNPAGEVDVVFSNAALHWVPDHERLFPRLLRSVAPGGFLAVQMPDNWNEPSHLLLRRVAADPRWEERTSPVLLRHPVADPAAYRTWLAGAADLDIWRTTYFHVLPGPDSVLEWVKGSVLAPVLAALTTPQARLFERELAAAYHDAYPAGAEGTTVFPFHRLFIVARAA